MPFRGQQDLRIPLEAQARWAIEKDPSHPVSRISAVECRNLDVSRDSFRFVGQCSQASLFGALFRFVKWGIP